MPRWSEEKLMPCGTKAAYARHIRAGQRGAEIDLACRLANQRDKNSHGKSEADRIYDAAAYRARRDLGYRYPEEYQELLEHYTRELRKEKR